MFHLYSVPSSRNFVEAHTLILERVIKMCTGLRSLSASWKVPIWARMVMKINAVYNRLP